MSATPQIIPERLSALTTLGHGSHSAPEVGMSAMEAAAFIAGEPHSDHPACVCPVIGAFMRAWNDGLDDDDRNAILLPLIPLTIGTRNPALEERRAMMAADWLVRTHTVAWLRLAKLDAQADMLANLPEITSMAQVPSIRGPLEAVRQDADAAWAAARDAAWAAAWDAAWAAARDAAWDAAWAAAWDAAWAAARDALRPVQNELQVSAVELVRRMCALHEADADVQSPSGKGGQQEVAD